MRERQITKPILILLCVCLFVLDLLVLVSLFLMLDLPLFALLFFALVLGVLVFAAIASLFLPIPKAKTRASSDKPSISRSEERSPRRIPSPASFEKPIIAMTIEPKPVSGRAIKITDPVLSKCPHGKTREYCAICDPDGYKHHYGDWEKD